jgi:hypothetical protein
MNRKKSAIQPIGIHPDNHHYYIFKGKPVIPIASAHHYGGVINLDFDYVKYFDSLHSRGQDYDRIYPGAHYGKYNVGDPMQPAPGRLILPWAQSSTPGFFGGGNKLDLDKWNPAYFTRLKDYLTTAQKRGIFVEICFFNGIAPESELQKQALYHTNNIQGIGTIRAADYMTLKDKSVVARQEAYVRKITEEVNGFDNIILEVCDEPGMAGTPETEYGPWVSRMVDAVIDAEKKLPVKHLLAQQFFGSRLGACDFTDDDRIPVIVGQYVGLEQCFPGMYQFGGIYLLDIEYGHDKPIEMNETLKYPFWVIGDDKPGNARVESWEFIIGGGTSFTQNSALYTVDDPTGGEETVTLCSALKNLKDFMYSFDFVKMRRDTSLIADGVPQGAFARGISEPGRQYALYMHHSELKNGNNLGYVVTHGKYADELTLNIATGTYTADWVDPVSGKVVRSDTIEHPGRKLTVKTPEYTVDIALRIKAKDIKN